MSEGAILLERKRATPFACGYVDVDVSAPPRQESAIGRVLVGDPYVVGPYSVDAYRTSEDEDNSDAVGTGAPSSSMSSKLATAPTLGNATSSEAGARLSSDAATDWSDVEWSSNAAHRRSLPSAVAEVSAPSSPALNQPAPRSDSVDGSLADVTEGNRSDGDWTSVSQVTVVPATAPEILPSPPESPLRVFACFLYLHTLSYQP